MKPSASTRAWGTVDGMDRLRLDGAALAALALAAGLGTAGCGADEGTSEQPRQAAETRQADEASGAGDVHADGGKNGEKGEDGESVKAEGDSASQSSSVTQSGSGSGDQSSSIVQRSGSGSTSSSSSSSGPDVKTFSGTGSTTLSFNVEEPSRFAWTNSEGGSFSARSAHISVESRSGRGEVSLDSGRYDDVKVRGSNWTIVVRPR
jgi:hypothetical protein